MIRGLFAFAAIGVMLVLADLTAGQCSVWRTSETLWAHATRVQPDSSIAHCEYGTVLVNRKAYADALPHLYRALDLWPGNVLAHRQIWRTWAEQGPSHNADLIAALRNSVELVPDFTDAHYNLACQLDESGQGDAAMAEYRATIERDPAHSRAHTNLAVLLKKHGQIAEALQHYEAGALADRQNLLAWRGWAILLHEQRRNAEALQAIHVAVEINPNDRLSRRYLQAWTVAADAVPTSAPAGDAVIAPPAPRGNQQ